MRGERIGHPAHSCMLCETTEYRWYIVRHGDAVVTWACDGHLAHILNDLARPNECTIYTVKLANQSEEGQ